VAADRGAAVTDAAPESPGEPAASAREDKPETPTVKYLRETRNAVVFIAWLLSVVTILGIAGAVVVAVHVHNENSPPSASCASQGGTEAGC
jgi:hypothetical protein